MIGDSSIDWMRVVGKMVFVVGVLFVLYMLQTHVYIYKYECTYMYIYTHAGVCLMIFVGSSHTNLNFVGQKAYKYHEDIGAFTYEHEALAISFPPIIFQGEEFQNVALFLAILRSLFYCN